MKKRAFLPVIICIILSLALVGCSPKPSPEDTVKEFLDAVGSGGYEALLEYASPDEQISIEETLTEQEKVMLELGLELFSKMTYKVNNQTITGDTATVDVSITNIDLNYVLTQTIIKASAELSSITDENEAINVVVKHIREVIADPNVPQKTNEVVFKLNKVDNKWELELTDELTNQISGGLLAP